MSKKICCIFNFGSHYRAPIYKMMGEQLDCDFYLGDNLPGEIKSFDANSLKGFKGYLTNICFNNKHIWQHGAIRLIFSSYDKYIICGDPACLSNWIILVLSRIFKKKTYLWTHGWYGDESKIKKYIKKAFFNLASHIFLYGDFARNLMINEGFPQNKLTCVYNSLNFEKQLSLRKSLKKNTLFPDHFKNDNLNLIFIGRLIDNKRIDLLIKALDKLNELSYNFNLTLIGNGEKRDELIYLASRLNLEKNIWFFGECYDEGELSQLIYNADLCISPGNVGLLAIHSMVFGTPVITHNNFSEQMPEFEIIKEWENGAFFDFEDFHSLAKTILEWFKIVPNREDVRNNCYKVIDEKYNPFYQIRVMKKVLI